MNKNSIEILEFKKTINITQKIEGYKEASPEVVKVVMALKKKYGIKVLSSR